MALKIVIFCHHFSQVETHKIIYTFTNYSSGSQPVCCSTLGCPEKALDVRSIDQLDAYK